MTFGLEAKKQKKMFWDIVKIAEKGKRLMGECCVVLATLVEGRSQVAPLTLLDDRKDN